MLVLSRKSQERIRISDDIIITVLKIKSNTVQIGIEAPREVPIIRGELPVFGPAEDGNVAEESATQECASTSDEDPAFVAEADATLQSYLRMGRRRRSVRMVAG